VHRPGLRHRTGPAKGAGPGDRAAVVVGGGIAGLVAAWELMQRGLDVTVLEQQEVFGGCVAARELGGLLLDSGAESYSTRSDTVPALARALGLGDRLVEPEPSGAWIQLPGRNLPASAAPLPRSGILGIPADLSETGVVRALGRAGALRASLDRVLPVGGIAERPGVSLGALVRSRMGAAVVSRLVAPVTAGVLSADPYSLDADAAAPGLRAALRDRGSLAAAAGALRAAAPAGSAVGGLAGGMAQLAGALTDRLRAGGAALMPGTAALSAERRGEGWAVTTSDRVLQADVLVVATDGRGAVDLMAPAVPELAHNRPEAVSGVALVTLMVDVPELDARPRGSGVLVAEGVRGVAAKALTHATAKWAWLADEAGPGSHVLRLSYGRAGDPVQPERDRELYAAALHDASLLLDTPIGADDVVDWDVVRWNNALPLAAAGHAERVARIRAAAEALPNLEITGGWLAGTGLVSVIDDARARAAALAGRLADRTAPPGM
jgi:oxygen-dependent protoporphyrinogen oxidase